MRNLCAILFFVLLCALLSSCAWLYQVTETEDPFSSDTAETLFLGSSAIPVDTALHAPDSDAITEGVTLLNVREGRYSNGNFVLELLRSDHSDDEYSLIIYTPKYSMRMFSGVISESEIAEGVLFSSDTDNDRILLTAAFSADGSSLSANITQDDVENTNLSGNYVYQDDSNDTNDAEPPRHPPTIAAGTYVHGAYEIVVAYSEKDMYVTVSDRNGVVLFEERTSATDPLASAIFRGEYGSVILVPTQDGLGHVILTGRTAGERFHAFAGTYTLKEE